MSNFRLSALLCGIVLKTQNGTVSTYLQTCMIDRRHRAYNSPNMNDVKFLRFTAWLCGTRAALVKMHAHLESAEKEWNFTVAVWYFLVPKGKVKHQRYSFSAERICGRGRLSSFPF